MGLIAAVPIGPVNLICIRRTFAFGPLNGFVSGLGAALGDGIFAAITGFGLTWIAQLIEGYATIIELIGGAMMVYFGYRTFISPAGASLRSGERRDSEGYQRWRGPWSRPSRSPITNPATLLVFAVHVRRPGWLGRRRGQFLCDASFVVAGVVGGSAGWWLA